MRDGKSKEALARGSRRGRVALLRDRNGADDSKTPAEACEPATSSLLKVRSCAFLLAVAWAWTLPAVEFTVGQMSVSPFAGTEVSANIGFFIRLR